MRDPRFASTVNDIVVEFGSPAAFFRNVREATLPPERKTRVLLGDPPIDGQHPQQAD